MKSVDIEDRHDDGRIFGKIGTALPESYHDGKATSVIFDPLCGRFWARTRTIAFDDLLERQT